MRCAEFEILYCDYLDGLLRDPEKSALEEHLESCAACAELAADIRGAVSFMERVPVVEPPGELLTRILHEIPSAKPAPERRSWWRKAFGSFSDTVLQPKFAMGMAMTMLSFSMLWKFSGIQARQLRASDFDPVKVWSAVDDRAHRTYDRAVKYYQNLRLVMEIQSRLKEWTEQQDQEQARAQQQQQQQVKQPAPKEQKK